MQLPCILSAISTRLGSSLSPPVFSCHGDDVKLHHRFSPVDGLRGGAKIPGQIHHREHSSSCENLLLCSASRRQTVVSSCPKCAKLFIYRPVSAETRSEPRYLSNFCFWGGIFAFERVVRRLSCFDGAARSRLILPLKNSLEQVQTSLSLRAVNEI